MKNSKKGKSVMVVAGLGVLILLVCIAGWLTLRMLDSTAGLDEVADTGGSESTTSDTALPSPPTVVTKKIPLPEKTPAPVPTTPTLPEFAPNTIATSPEATPSTLEQPANIPADAQIKKPEKPEQPAEILKTDSAPPEIQTDQSQGSPAVSSPEVTDREDSAPPIEPVPESSERFSIQVGAFQSKEYALDRAAILKALGYDSYIFTGSGAKGRIWHTVRIGRFDTLEKAREVELSFKQESDFPTAVVYMNSLKPVPTKS